MSDTIGEWGAVEIDMQEHELLHEVLTDSFLLGAVRLNERWRVYAGTLAEWTLDYPSYDPDNEPRSEEDRMSFRNGLWYVDENNAEEFCEAMQAYEIPLGVLRHWIAQKEANAVPLLMLVDFDNRLFVHGYSEPVE